VSVTDVHRGTPTALDAAPEGRTDRHHGVHPGAALRPRHPRAAHLGHPALRTADGHHRDERRASWLELFFDLAFAGAVGQLAGAFQRHPGLGALAGFVILFTPIWWLWVQLTFYADRHETKDAAHRISTLAAILLCVALAASAPRALDGQSAGFVIVFVCLRGLQLLLYARVWRHLPATRPLYSCYLIWFSAGGALWLASLAVGGSARYAFWGVALIADAVGSLAMLTPRRRLPLNSAHLADRFQIFVLIVLGESMARLISAAAARPPECGGGLSSSDMASAGRAGPANRLISHSGGRPTRQPSVSISEPGGQGIAQSGVGAISHPGDVTVRSDQRGGRGAD
jgi:hypothetical protein